MEPPAKVIDFLPTAPSKWVLWLSWLLATSLYALLTWLQVDTLLPQALATKLAILLPSIALLLISAYITLALVVLHVRKLEATLHGYENRSFWEKGQPHA